MLRKAFGSSVVGNVGIAVLLSMAAMVAIAASEPETESKVDSPQLVPQNPQGGEAPEVVPPVPTGKALYKSVDESGKITFTDTPPAGRQAEEVRIHATNKVAADSGRKNNEETEQKTDKPVKYKKLEITSPTNDQQMGQEVQSVSISASVEPGLQEGHRIQLYLDGAAVGNGASSYTASPIDRGTHTVQAKIFDGKNKLMKSSPMVQFHVRRISALNKLTATPLPANAKGKNASPKPTTPAGGFGAPKAFNSTGDANAPKAAASGKDMGSSRDIGSPQDVGSPGTRR